MASAKGDRVRRWSVVGLSVVGAALFAVSWLLPWWNFSLVAPQYPMGLKLQLWLTGVTGNVDEIDILNHYIGMHPMTEAAQTEAHLSRYLVSLVAVVVVAALVAAGRKWSWIGLLAALGLPVGFLVDTFLWMYWFGHDLDPHAPLNFDVFTPSLLGPGTVGQFHTWAWPATGYWLALSGVLAVGVALGLRRRVCQSCPAYASCGTTCPRLMVLPEQHGHELPPDAAGRAS